MVLYNLGSVIVDVSNFIGPSNIPSNLSGTGMNNLVTQQINYLNTYTNDAIGIIDIAEKYQPSIINLSMSQILLAIEANQGGIDTASLGELSISQGGDPTEYAKILRQDAVQRLQELGRYVRYKRIISS